MFGRILGASGQPRFHRGVVLLTNDWSQNRRSMQFTFTCSYLQLEKTLSQRLLLFSEADAVVRLDGGCTSRHMISTWFLPLRFENIIASGRYNSGRREGKMLSQSYHCAAENFRLEWAIWLIWSLYRVNGIKKSGFIARRQCIDRKRAGPRSSGVDDILLSSIGFFFLLSSCGVLEISVILVRRWRGWVGRSFRKSLVKFVCHFQLVKNRGSFCLYHKAVPWWGLVSVGISDVLRRKRLRNVFLGWAVAATQSVRTTCAAGLSCCQTITWIGMASSSSRPGLNGVETKGLKFGIRILYAGPESRRACFGVFAIFFHLCKQLFKL